MLAVGIELPGQGIKEVLELPLNAKVVVFQNYGYANLAEQVAEISEEGHEVFVDDVVYPVHEHEVLRREGVLDIYGESTSVREYMSTE